MKWAPSSICCIFKSTSSSTPSFSKKKMAHQPYRKVSTHIKAPLRQFFPLSFAHLDPAPAQGHTSIITQRKHLVQKVSFVLCVKTSATQSSQTIHEVRAPHKHRCVRSLLSSLFDFSEAVPCVSVDRKKRLHLKLCVMLLESSDRNRKREPGQTSREATEKRHLTHSSQGSRPRRTPNTPERKTDLTHNCKQKAYRSPQCANHTLPHADAMFKAAAGKCFPAAKTTESEVLRWLPADTILLQKDRCSTSSSTSRASSSCHAAGAPLESVGPADGALQNLVPEFDTLECQLFAPRRATSGVPPRLHSESEKLVHQHFTLLAPRFALRCDRERTLQKLTASPEPFPPDCSGCWSAAM